MSSAGASPSDDPRLNPPAWPVLASDGDAQRPPRPDWQGERQEERQAERRPDRRDEVRWQDDPGVRSAAERDVPNVAAPTVRNVREAGPESPMSQQNQPVPAGVAHALSTGAASVVLDQGRAVVVPLPRLEALRRGYTVLDPEPYVRQITALQAGENAPEVRTEGTSDTQVHGRLEGTDQRLDDQQPTPALEPGSDGRRPLTPVASEQAVASPQWSTGLSSIDPTGAAPATDLRLTEPGGRATELGVTETLRSQVSVPARPIAVPSVPASRQTNAAPGRLPEADAASEAGPDAWTAVRQAVPWGVTPPPVVEGPATGPVVEVVWPAADAAPLRVETATSPVWQDPWQTPGDPPATGVVQRTSTPKSAPIKTALDQSATPPSPTWAVLDPHEAASGARRPDPLLPAPTFPLSAEDRATEDLATEEFATEDLATEDLAKGEVARPRLEVVREPTPTVAEPLGSPESPQVSPVEAVVDIVDERTEISRTSAPDVVDERNGNAADVPHAEQTDHLSDAVSDQSEVPTVSLADIQRAYDGPFGKVPVLRGVSLLVAPGDLVVISGPTGAGATTLLQCAAGLDRVDGGHVSVNGESMALWSDADRARFRAASSGFIPQDHELVEDLNAVDNVALPLLAAGWSHAPAHAEAQRRLERFELGDRSAFYPSQRSRGERARVAVARALAGDPFIVWADDPTAGLDEPHADTVANALLEHHGRGATLVVVSRDRRFASTGARGFVLNDGVLSELRFERSEGAANDEQR